MFFDPDAPLLGFKGYTGVERVRSFKDYIKRLTEENERLPLEQQSAILRDEAAAFARALELKAEKRKSDFGTTMPPLGGGVASDLDPLLDTIRHDVPTTMSLDGVARTGTFDFPMDVDDHGLTKREVKRQRGSTAAASSSVVGGAARSGPLDNNHKSEFKAAWAMLGDAVSKILETAITKLAAANTTPAPTAAVTTGAFDEQKKKIERIKSVIAMFENGEGESSSEHVVQLKEKLKVAEAEFVQMVLKM
jgi:hypothetical protein